MDIKRLIRVVGRGGALWAVLSAINWSVRAAGDVDFVLQSVEDPGWLKSLAVALFVSPPWFVVVAFFGASAAMLYLTRDRSSLSEGDKATLRGRVTELATENEARDLREAIRQWYVVAGADAFSAALAVESVALVAIPEDHRKTTLFSYVTDLAPSWWTLPD